MRWKANVYVPGHARPVPPIASAVSSESVIFTVSHEPSYAGRLERYLCWWHVEPYDRGTAVCLSSRGEL